ncbi:MAG: hypothetical protein M0R77_09665 [Gammaproteobacteria bacterium]|nr:hypothetical protein [Gammaproteobacteria bacterium]
MKENGIDVLGECGVTQVHHYAPLHYLPFIAREKALLCKPTLARLGFGPSHLRSMSSKQDIERGFGDCAFLTIDFEPRIVKAKLFAGFPHIALRVPSKAFLGVDFSLCRYNVAMTRVLRRHGMPGRPESATNGRYYDKRQLPVARELPDKKAMLKEHLPRRTMIEVLVHGDFFLPSDTTVICYAEEDAKIARLVLSECGVPWGCACEPPPGPYRRNRSYVSKVEEFIETALMDPAWRGNGLEFDRV